jgi:oligogalacturonide transport system permease protein
MEIAQMQTARARERRKNRFRAVNLALRYLLLIGVGFIMLYPLLWMFGSSLKADNNEIFATISLFPKSPSLEAYRQGWTETGFPFGQFM